MKNASKEHRQEQSGGGNLVGRAPSAPKLSVPAFQGSSGQPNNQSTKRPKGNN